MCFLIMISYKEYYLKCIKNYNKSNSNQLIYNFGISVEKPNNFKYLKLDDTFYQLIGLCPTKNVLTYVGGCIY